MEKILITVREAQNLLGVGKNAIYSLLKQKGFPCLKIGNKYYVNYSKLKEWANKHTM